MKKLLAIVLALVLALSLTAVAWATESEPPCTGGDGCTCEAAIVDTHYKTLAAALNAVSEEGATITLLKNVTLTTNINVKGKVVLDLAGHTIQNGSAAFTGNDSDSLVIVHYGADLTITDSVGEGAINATHETAPRAAVKLTSTQVTGSSMKLTVEGGTIQGHDYAITGNGTRHGTEVVINGGTIISDKATAIYHPQEGTLTINGGTITGATSAVEIRSGTLNISDGSLTATATEFTENPNGSGTTMTGVAVAVSQHTTDKEIKVNITGGTFDGVKALYEKDLQNTAGDSKSIAITVNDGTFNGAVESNSTTAEDAKVLTISGGSYTAEVTDYVAENTVAIKDGNGKYAVGTTAEEVAKNAKPGDTITVLKGDSIQVPNRVTVENKTGSEITVNNKTVQDNGTYIKKPSSGGSYTPPADDTVNSADTFDAGVALYAGMALTSALGAAYVTGKRR